MLYTTDISVGIQIQNSTLPSSFMDQTTSNNLNVTSQQTIEVVSFDGQYYTLNHTTTMTIADKPFTVSLLEKMNKTGYSTYMIDLGNSGPLTESSTAYQEYLTQLISRPEVKVGDRIIIQFPTTENTIFAVIGNLTLTFGGIEELTVPAGTFKVFRIDLTSTDLKLDLSKLQTTATADLLNGLKMSISSQMYMEYGTMRQIKSTMQENMIYQSSMLNATINLTADMTLNQDIKP
jgi:hypothetical protein